MRFVALLFAFLATTIMGQAQNAQSAIPPGYTVTFPPAPGLKILPLPEGHSWAKLWPEGAPGQQGEDDADIPAVSLFLPASNPTHTLVVVAPGGGYVHLAMKHEGYDIAQWLNDHGVAALMLRYRLGPKYHHPIELGDAQRAIRYARTHASEWDVDPAHIGIWGFSAGGHLASSTGTHFDAGNPAATDGIDRASSRPDFMVLAYPVISFDPAIMHAGSRKYLLGSDQPDPALVTLMSNEQQVTAQTPPTFLFATTDDATVPVMNSVRFYSALVQAKVPAEMHLFKHGAHGAGLAPNNPDLKVWPDLLLTWMRGNGWAQ